MRPSDLQGARDIPMAVSPDLKRFLFISTMEGLPWGGSEELWSQAAAHLRRSGHAVGVCTMAWDTPVPGVEALRSLGCAIHLRRDMSRSEWWGRRLTGRSTDVTHQWIDSFQPDLVVVSDGAFCYDCHLADYCRSRSLPYMLVAQAASSEWWPPDDHAQTIRRVYEAARRVCFVSNANRSLVESMLGWSAASSCVVRNPFNLPCDAVCSWPDESTYRLACVARLEPNAKGQDVLFSVLARPHWRERNLHVALYGDGRSEQSLRTLCSRLGLQQVSFEGCAPVTEIWERNHGLLLPSRYEGLPLALVEAMFCGRPSIVTDVAGNSEVLTDNVTGFIAAAPTPDLLDEAMERAWARRFEWRAIGECAAASIRTQYPRDPSREFAQVILEQVR